MLRSHPYHFKHYILFHYISPDSSWGTLQLHTTVNFLVFSSSQFIHSSFIYLFCVSCSFFLYNQTILTSTISLSLSYLCTLLKLDWARGVGGSSLSETCLAGFHMNSNYNSRNVTIAIWQILIAFRGFAPPITKYQPLDGRDGRGISLLDLDGVVFFHSRLCIHWGVLLDSQLLL